MDYGDITQILHKKTTNVIDRVDLHMSGVAGTGGEYGIQIHICIL